MQNHRIMIKMPFFFALVHNHSSHPNIVWQKYPSSLLELYSLPAGGSKWQCKKQRLQMTLVTKPHWGIYMYNFSFEWINSPCISGNGTVTELLPQPWFLLKGWVYCCCAPSSKLGDEIITVVFSFWSGGMDWTERRGHGREKFHTDCSRKEI